jgi:hypothetical protein
VPVGQWPGRLEGQQAGCGPVGLCGSGPTVRKSGGLVSSSLAVLRGGGPTSLWGSGPVASGPWQHGGAGPPALSVYGGVEKTSMV